MLILLVLLGGLTVMAHRTVLGRRIYAIGGTSMRGGAGTVAGVLIGALLMASLDNGMSMIDLDTYWQMIFKVNILLLAVWLDIASYAKN